MPRQTQIHVVVFIPTQRLRIIVALMATLQDCACDSGMIVRETRRDLWVTVLCAPSDFRDFWNSRAPRQQAHAARNQIMLVQKSEASGTERVKFGPLTRFRLGMIELKVSTSSPLIIEKN